MGATGAVYSAVDGLTGQVCAIKMLNPSTLADPTTRPRFRREAEIAQRLSHPGIVNTTAFLDEPDGRLAIVMELVEGESLSGLLNDAPLPMDRVLRITVGLLDAVDYVHGQGVTRLDLKPANILVRADDSPVLLDFGIARFETTQHRITQESPFIGTPAYMAPEQATGQAPDERSDVYSAGIVLFEMLGGSLSLTNESPLDILTRRLHMDLDLSGLTTSDDMRGVLARATARDRDERYPTAADFRGDLLQTPEYADLRGYLQRPVAGWRAVTRPTSPGPRCASEMCRYACVRSSRHPGYGSLVLHRPRWAHRGHVPFGSDGVKVGHPSLGRRAVSTRSGSFTTCATS